MAARQQRPPFKPQARMRMRPKPRPTPEPQVSLPGDVALTFRNLDEIGQTDDGRLYLGDPSNIVETKPPAAEPAPKSINVRSSW